MRSIRPFRGVEAAALIVASVAGTAASAEPSLHTPSPGTDRRAGLARPDWQPLSAGEIEKALSGKMLSLDAHPWSDPKTTLFVTVGAHCDMPELFSADGHWKFECGRPERWRIGFWYVRDGRLCSLTDAYIEACRTVWQSIASDRFVLSDGFDDSFGWRPYRVTSIPVDLGDFSVPPIVTAAPTVLERGDQSEPVLAK